jgi:hypothetical protein
MCNYAKCTKCNLETSKQGLKTHIKTCTGKLNCSSGELLVMNILKSLNIKYLYNTSYDNVKDKNLLRWDFVIETDGDPIFIEYDGSYHTLPVRYGGISQEQAEINLLSIKKRDKIKNDYCDDNGYLLLRIPYYEKENIKNIITEFIANNTIL